MEPSNILEGDSTAEVIDAAIETLITYGMSVIGAALILILGWLIAGGASRFMNKRLTRIEHIDDMLRGFICNLLRYVIIIFTVIAVLGQFGIQTTSLVAILGAASLAIGFALQGTLSNLAGGVMLLLFRPFKIGDFIDASGHSGTVKALTLFTIELATPDNVRVIVPNSEVWGKAIHNFSTNPTRRIDICIGMAYDDDIDKALKVCLHVAEADSRILKDPAPTSFVGELGDSSVNLTLRIWCKAGDYWALKWDTTKAIKQAFDQAHLRIPFPQRDIHMVSSK